MILSFEDFLAPVEIGIFRSDTSNSVSFSMGSRFILKTFLIFIFYVYGCFACMYFVHRMCAVPKEAKKGHWIPLEL